MADNLLDEYKAYYAVRAERYAGNPNYSNSYAAEKRLSDAFQSCNSLDEFKDKMGDLNERCASALAKDQYIMDQKHFKKHKEAVRVLLSDRILEKIDSCNNVNDLFTMIGEESTKNSIEVSMDESNDCFIENWKLLDDIELYSNAEVPEKYKADMDRMVNITRESIIDNAKSREENNQAWEEGWKLNPDIIVEYRFRRLLPYTDEQVQTQIERFKKIINS
ncbi:MAG: hypothetical protein RBS19_10600 [Bacteroidales bacterium]|nr:hypothetical protein [Bacteroidales bacterium]